MVFCALVVADLAGGTVGRFADVVGLLSPPVPDLLGLGLAAASAFFFRAEPGAGLPETADFPLPGFPAFLSESVFVFESEVLAAVTAATAATVAVVAAAIAATGRPSSSLLSSILSFSVMSMLLGGSTIC